MNDIDDLNLFILEVDRLLSKSFYYQSRNNEIGFSNISDLDTSPDEELLEAYVLHLRKFFQDSERVSIKRINELVSLKLCQNDEHFLEWNNIYLCLCGMMQSPSLCDRDNDYLCDGERLTIEKLFKTKIYGDLFHLDKAKRDKLRSLTSSPDKDALFRFEFHNFLVESGELLSELSLTAKKIIKVL